MRLLLATDQPFWHCRGGAQQRMGCLWRGLRELLGDAGTPAPGAVFFLGDPGDLPSRAEWERLALGQLFAPRSKSPPGWDWTRLFSATAGPALAAATSRTSGPTSGPTSGQTNAGPPETRAQTLHLADYAWPWVAGPFRRALQQFEPDVVILEYITMAYLIDMASPQQRERTVWAVDTHDCLAERARQFQAAGHSHWLAVTAEEEIAALEPADVVIAIQAQEAAWFAQRLRRPRVVVAQHAPPVVTRSPVVAGPSVVAAGESGDAPPAGPAIQAAVPPGSRPLVVGFIASNNVPNRCGIQEWLLQVGGSLGGLPIQLIFAGSICDDLQARLTRGELEATALPPLQLLGTIGSLPDFYRRCDVVVNPVAWGTGLKIKTIEALAFHRPVLASEHAGSHLEAIESGVLTCRDPQSWIDCLQTLATRPEQLERLQHQARNYARRALSPAAVYGDLAQQLQQLSQQKKAEPTQS